ncbi:DUF4339 domain-containing protein [Flavobacterium daejeonense]|uniref:DUF4339 domain-containing protein n=1 Tax=Flavobacterium daejeonense TaxID=350893 RepID=UPI00047BC9D8|nr:GYF domain-containing protein [Flavobacterium daejeonense]
MKKYYLHNGVESSGPFSLTELEEKQITAATPVWFSGMPDWKTAGEIEELQTLLKVTPPPFKSNSPTPKSKEKSNKIMGLNKGRFYLFAFLTLLVIGSFALNFINENRKQELEARNDKTERENRQFLLQEEEIKAQKEQLAEKERLEAERLLKEKKGIINKRLSEIQIEHLEKQNLFEATKNELVKANQFHFFRTEEEKNNEINIIQTKLKLLQDELESLDRERTQLNLELENIQLKH